MFAQNLQLNPRSSLRDDHIWSISKISYWLWESDLRSNEKLGVIRRVNRERLLGVLAKPVRRLVNSTYTQGVLTS